MVLSRGDRDWSVICQQITDGFVEVYVILIFNEQYRGTGRHGHKAGC